MIPRGSQLLESENLKAASNLFEQAQVLLTSRPDAVAADPIWRLALLKVLDRLAVARTREGDSESALVLFNRGLSLDDDTRIWVNCFRPESSSTMQSDSFVSRWICFTTLLRIPAILKLPSKR
jgi:hypothetical protein